MLFCVSNINISHSCEMTANVFTVDIFVDYNFRPSHFTCIDFTFVSLRKVQEKMSRYLH